MEQELIINGRFNGPPNSGNGGYTGIDYHIFPTCFVCGPRRSENDGLKIYPGRAETHQPEMVASSWTPTADLSDD